MELQMFLSGEIGTDENLEFLDHWNIKKGVPAFDTIFNDKQDLVKFIEDNVVKK